MRGGSALFRTVRRSRRRKGPLLGLPSIRPSLPHLASPPSLPPQTRLPSLLMSPSRRRTVEAGSNLPSPRNFRASERRRPRHIPLLDLLSHSRPPPSHRRSRHTALPPKPSPSRILPPSPPRRLFLPTPLVRFLLVLIVSHLPRPTLLKPPTPPTSFLRRNQAKASASATRTPGRLTRCRCSRTRTRSGRATHRLVRGRSGRRMNEEGSSAA